MASSRPARSAYIVLAVLLGLLPVLAIYQYRRIGEISQAQRRDAEDHLNQAGFQMSQLEIRGRSDREDLSDWFAQRYDMQQLPTLVSFCSIVRRN